MKSFLSENLAFTWQRVQAGKMYWKAIIRLFACIMMWSDLQNEIHIFGFFMKLVLRPWQETLWLFWLVTSKYISLYFKLSLIKILQGKLILLGCAWDNWKILEAVVSNYGFSSWKLFMPIKCLFKMIVKLVSLKGEKCFTFWKKLTITQQHSVAWYVLLIVPLIIYRLVYKFLVTFKSTIQVLTFCTSSVCYDLGNRIVGNV